MKILVTMFVFFFAPFSASPFPDQIDSAEMWWCSSCGLAYPASQKCCLNKDCPLFRKKK